MDSEMIQFGIDMVHDLDKRFGLPLKRTLSQRDIPGMSVGILSPLISRGIEAISVGVNGASAPPVVPSVFVWKKPQSQESIIGMWHPGEYGGLNVSDAVLVSGLKHALIMNWRPDNYGPGDSGMNMDDFEHVQKQFPNAKVFASTFDSFLDVLIPFKDKLPVIEAEIGDTWIWGVQSDPHKQQAMRQLMRLRKQYRVPFEFDRLFLKTFEHTWGLDPKRSSNDFERHWANIPFEAVRRKGWFEGLEASWHEQRLFIQKAIEMLPQPLQKIFNESLESLRPTEKDPSADGFFLVPQNRARGNFSCNRMQFQFDRRSGLNYLKDLRNGRVFTSYDRPLGQYIYSTYNSTNYLQFFQTYGYCYGEDSCWYLPLDFGKPGVNEARPESRTWFADTNSLWQKEDDQFCYFEQQLSMHPIAHTYYGAPKQIWVSYQFSKQESKINFNYTLYGKTTTRLPEAHWVYFNPLIQNGNWKIDIIGSDIDPQNVVKNGSHNLFPQLDGIKFVGDQGDTVIHIESLDSGFLSIGAPNPFPLLNASPQRIMNGFYFNLANNVWGTNFVLWYPFDPADENLLSRFTMTF